MATYKKLFVTFGSAIALLAAGIAMPVVAQTAELPALIRTTIPSGEPDGGRISYSIALGEGRELRITVDAGRLVVTVAGSIKNQFKIFRLDGADFVALDCSAGFLGSLVGTISCRDVEPGTRLVFARKDIVNRVIPEEQIVEVPSAEELVISGGDGSTGGATDEFGFFNNDQTTGGEVAGSGTSAADEFSFSSGDLTFGNEISGGEFSAPEEQPTIFDQVSEFFGFTGGAEQPAEATPETGGDMTSFGFEDNLTTESAPAGEQVAPEIPTDQFAFGEEQTAAPAEEAAITGGPEAAGEQSLFSEGGTAEGEAPVFSGEPSVEGLTTAEGGAPAEEKLLPRLAREIRDAVRVMQYKIADVIIKLYVKPLPLAPAASSDEGAADVAAPMDEEAVPLE